MSTKIYSVSSKKIDNDVSVIISDDRIHFSTCSAGSAYDIVKTLEPNVGRPMHMSLSLFKKLEVYKQFRHQVETYFSS